MPFDLMEKKVYTVLGLKNEKKNTIKAHVFQVQSSLQKQP